MFQKWGAFCFYILHDFIIHATPWWEQGEDVSPGNPAHDRFIRSRLLEDTGHVLSAEEKENALSMAEDQFLAAIAMAIETGENVTELFRPAAAS